MIHPSISIPLTKPALRILRAEANAMGTTLEEAANGLFLKAHQVTLKAAIGAILVDSWSEPQRVSTPRPAKSKKGA